VFRPPFAGSRIVTGPGALSGRVSTYATLTTRGELKRSRLNVINVTVREMKRAKPAFSHGSLAMIKWTVCHHREIVCLPETRCETDAVLLGDEQGGWRMGDALIAMGVKRPPRGPL
jgi:hypothetical protein